MADTANKQPSKHEGSDSEAFWLRPVCSQNRAGLYMYNYMPDPTSSIRFGSVLPKKARITLCKTGSDPIWTAWSGFGQTNLVRKQA